MKQVIVIRKDLKMRRGKEIAQGAHASMKVLLDRSYVRDNLNNTLCINATEAMLEWVRGTFTKITCCVDSEKELVELYDKAVENGIPAAMVVDNGYTEFKGVPTKTAVAIGPDVEERIDKVTGHLRLY